jgi:tight adherence protein B
MTSALLALAAALLVAPTRRRAVDPNSSVPARRPTKWWTAAGAGSLVIAVALVAPMTVAAALVVVASTVALRRHRANLRARRAIESAALQAALDVLAGELRAGAHPVVAFETAAAEVPDDVAASLRAVAARARFGVDVAAGLHAAAAGSAVPTHWRRLAVCWELAHRHGLAIATLMRTAHREFVERERFESRFAAAMAGARTTALVLAGLPVLGIGLGQLVDADPVRFLLSGGLGGGLLVVGTMLACTGLLWSDRITNRTPR